MAVATPGGIDIWFDGTRWMSALYGTQTPLNYTADQIAAGIASGAFRLVGTQASPDVAAKLAARNVPLAQAQPLGLRSPAQPAYNGPVGDTGSGAITAPQPQGASPFGERLPDGTIRAPDGAILSSTGAIISRPAAQPAATTMTAPQPQAVAAQPAQGNNPDAVFNAVTGTWNVDPATQRARTAGSPPPAATTTATATNALPFSAEFAGTDYTDPTLRGLWGQLMAPQPLSADGLRLPQFAAGGMMPYQDGGMEPNALVGEGLEAANTELDGGNEFRGEAVWVPTGQPGTYKGYFAEGPVATALPGGTLIHPVSRQNEETFRARLLPIDQMPAAKEEAVGGDLAAYKGGGVVPMPGMRPPMPQRPAIYGDGAGGMRGAA